MGAYASYPLVASVVASVVASYPVVALASYAYIIPALSCYIVDGTWFDLVDEHDIADTFVHSVVVVHCLNYVTARHFHDNSSSFSSFYF